MSSYNKVIQLNQNNAKAWNSKGRTLDHLKNYQEAIER